MYIYTKKLLRKPKENIKISRLNLFKSYKNNELNFLMNHKKNIIRSSTPDFFSKEMLISKKALNENQLKYTYQKQLISNLDYKHKEWSKFLGS